jgi:uncharacterized protein (DUF1800 family)
MHRLGFGASDRDIDSSARDPHTWLTKQLDSVVADEALNRSIFGKLPGSDQTASVFPTMLRRAGLAGGAMRGLRGMVSGASSGSSGDANKAMSNDTGSSRAVQRMLPYLTAELEARMRYACATPTPFLERLVWFWSNHLTVSAQRFGLYPLVGPFEREAIRPHVLGRLEDMLLSALRHPAMQIYLDNFRSVGPNTSAVGSGYGQMRRTGVNENLAREVLELHTLGDRTAYSQNDVRELALALTGWGLGGLNGGFAFDARAHEPGTRTLLGKKYAQEGASQVEAMIVDLAHHPATARHVARKLLAHFGSETTDESDMTRLSKVYLRTRGDLRSLALALIELPSVLRTDVPSRVKRPDEFAASVWRTLGIEPPSGPQIYAQLQTLGQTSWSAPAPIGWSDRSADWLGPDQLLARIEWCETLVAEADSDRNRIVQLDARALGQRAFPRALSSHTQREIERAESGAQALVLLLASPEFLRS